MSTQLVMGFNSEKALGNTDQRSSAICCPQGWHTKPLRAGLSLPLQGPWPLSFPHPTTSHTSDAEVLLLLVSFSQLDNSSLPPGDAPFLVLQELALLSPHLEVRYSHLKAVSLCSVSVLAQGPKKQSLRQGFCASYCLENSP